MSWGGARGQNGLYESPGPIVSWLLFRVFRCLVHNHRNPVISVYQFESSQDFYYFGSCQICRYLSVPTATINKFVTAIEPSKILSSLFNSATRAGFQFSALRLNYGGSKYYLRPENSLLWGGLKALACNPWANLTELSVSLIVDAKSMDGILAKCIQNAPNIQILRVQSGHDLGVTWDPDENPILTWLDATFSSHRLRELDIIGFDGLVSRFTNILGHHCDSLKALRICHNHVRKHECWTKVFRFILEQLNLSTLGARSLYKDQHERLLTDSLYDLAWILGSETEVRTALSDVVNSSVRYVAENWRESENYIGIRGRDWFPQLDWPDFLCDQR